MSALTALIHRIGRIPIVLILMATLLGLLRLPTAPPLWWDEGWTLTVARNWVETGHYGRFLAGDPISSRLAAAPPVVLPAALSLRLFGLGAWQGRLPGVVFTALTLWFLYRLTAKLFSQRAGVAALALALLTPMYTAVHPVFMGKQVLAEMPALCFLLGGYLLLFNGLAADRFAEIIGAGLLWGLAVVTKVQAMPFLTVSVGVAGIVLLRQRKWRSFTRWLLPLLTAIAVFLTWWRFGSRRLAAAILHGDVGGLLWVTALVPSLVPRLMALFATIAGGLPAVSSLAYAARRHLSHRSLGLQRLALWSLAASWLTWYLLLSAGVPRYLFPATFLSLIFLAGFLMDVTDDFDAEAWRCLRERLRPRRWRCLTRPQRAVALLLLVVVPFSLTRSINTYLQADDSLFHLADYLDSHVPPDALIESYDPEVMFLSDQPYHYPPDQVHIQVIRQTLLGDQTVEIDYDPLVARLDYLVAGPWSKLWNLYPENWLLRHFRLEERFGPYDLYRFAGSQVAR